jgi:uncharacterized damage-inducible protein DinB
MSTLQPWFERKFSFDLPLERFPAIVERLRGTPARVEERARCIPPAALVARLQDSWSIQEIIGHLGDVEPIWIRRAEQILEGQTELATADLTNSATSTANHNAAQIDELLARLRGFRARFVSLLEGADGQALQRAARHPRLGTPMRLIDIAFFTAEHDDHHLARITEILRQQEPAGG